MIAAIRSRLYQTGVISTSSQGETITAPSRSGSCGAGTTGVLAGIDDMDVATSDAAST